MNQIGHRCRIEAKTLLPDHGNKTGAGLEGRIVELPVALVALKMRGVCRRKKRALMMIEPPGDLRRTRILEIDDGIFVAVEMGFVEERSGAMQQAGELKIHIAADALAVEAGEERRRRRSIETLVVVENLDFQSIPQLPKISAARAAHKSTQFSCGVKANRNDSLEEESQGPQRSKSFTHAAPPEASLYFHTLLSG